MKSKEQLKDYRGKSDADLGKRSASLNYNALSLWMALMILRRDDSSQPDEHQGGEWAKCA